MSKPGVDKLSFLCDNKLVPINVASFVPSSEPWGSFQGQYNVYSAILSVVKTLVLNSVMPGVEGSHFGQLSLFSRTQIMK